MHHNQGMENPLNPGYKGAHLPQVFYIDLGEYKDTAAGHQEAVEGLGEAAQGQGEAEEAGEGQGVAEEAGEGQAMMEEAAKGYDVEDQAYCLCIQLSYCCNTQQNRWLEPQHNPDPDFVCTDMIMVVVPVVWQPNVHVCYKLHPKDLVLI
jgi:hypothetical protein